MVGIFVFFLFYLCVTCSSIPLCVPPTGRFSCFFYFSVLVWSLPHFQVVSSLLRLLLHPFPHLLYSLFTVDSFHLNLQFDCLSFKKKIYKCQQAVSNTLRASYASSWPTLWLPPNCWLQFSFGHAEYICLYWIFIRGKIHRWAGFWFQLKITAEFF